MEEVEEPPANGDVSNSSSTSNREESKSAKRVHNGDAIDSELVPSPAKKHKVNAGTDSKGAQTAKKCTKAEARANFKALAKSSREKIAKLLTLRKELIGKVKKLENREIGDDMDKEDLYDKEYSETIQVVIEIEDKLKRYGVLWDDKDQDEEEPIDEKIIVTNSGSEPLNEAVSKYLTEQYKDYQHGTPSVDREKLLELIQSLPPSDRARLPSTYDNELERIHANIAKDVGETLKRMRAAAYQSSLRMWAQGDSDAPVPELPEGALAPVVVPSTRSLTSLIVRESMANASGSPEHEEEAEETNTANGDDDEAEIGETGNGEGDDTTVDENVGDEEEERDNGEASEENTPAAVQEIESKNDVVDDHSRTEPTPPICAASTADAVVNSLSPASPTSPANDESMPTSPPVEEKPATIATSGQEEIMQEGNTETVPNEVQGDSTAQDLNQPSDPKELPTNEAVAAVKEVPVVDDGDEEIAVVYARNPLDPADRGPPIDKVTNRIAYVQEWLDKRCEDIVIETVDLSDDEGTVEAVAISCQTTNDAKDDMNAYRAASENGAMEVALGHDGPGVSRNSTAPTAPPTPRIQDSMETTREVITLDDD